MSIYIANLLLEKAPNTLGELEIEIRKSLKFHMSGTWKKPCFKTPYSWTFDDLSISSQLGGEPFFDGALWHHLSKQEKLVFPIEDFFDGIKPTGYRKANEISEVFLQDLVANGEVLFPDGSSLSQGQFKFAAATELESHLALKFSRRLFSELLKSGGLDAAKSAILKKDCALLLCEFREAPQW